MDFWPPPPSVVPMSDPEGEIGEPDEIEAGSPSVENAVFVVLGALSTVLVFVHLAGLLP